MKIVDASTPIHLKRRFIVLKLKLFLTSSPLFRDDLHSLEDLAAC